MNASAMQPVPARAPLPITAVGLVTALGHGQAATAQALAQGRTGLKQQRFETAHFDAWLGLVPALEQALPLHLDPALAPADDNLPGATALAPYDCRNNRLAALALHSEGFGAAVLQAKAHYGAQRVGVFLGTSTSGILHTEQAYRERLPETGALPPWLSYGRTHDTYSLARYVRAALGLAGPAQVVSTACSSSAKVFATAARMIDLNLIDAAVVGGVDSLCLTTLYGFAALELVSPQICRPWDAQRKGLSLGEGAALLLLERPGRAGAAAQGQLLGYGETSDGYHMSSPHPQGEGAAQAMRHALASAGLQANEVDYLNLHGTATPGNDAAEDQAVCAVFGQTIAASSTKGFTGHTLGAAGGVEAAVCLIALREGLMPASLNLQEQDPNLKLPVLTTARKQGLRYAASNSFGFGGSNCSLVFGAAA